MPALLSRRRAGRRTAVLALAAGLAPWPAQSQAPEPGATLEATVVTGTRARDRTEIDSPVPVDVLTRAELRRAAGGTADLGTALQVLLPAFNLPRQSTSGVNDHVRPAQLRGLSPDQVLVLVNGKRRHVTATLGLEGKTGRGTNPVDFASIPVSAIRRIEVLRDGAAAQYGSDAIAGVINVILDDAEGGEAGLEASAHRTGFRPTERDALRITDGQALSAALAWGARRPDGSFLRGGVESTSRKATNRAGFGSLPFFEEQTPANLALDGQRTFRPGDPDLEELKLWFNGARQASGPRSVYAFGTFDRRNSVGAAFFRFPDGPSNVRAIYPDGFRPETTGTNRDLGLSLGMRSEHGSAGGWDSDVALSYGENRFDYGVRRSLNASLGTASPTGFALGDFRYGQWTLNADASRPLQLGGTAQTARLALGLEARREQYRSRPGDPASYALGPDASAQAGAQAGPGLQPGDAADTSRDVLGAYADLSAQLGPAWFAMASARFDRTGDFGSSTTAKVATRLSVLPWLGLRAAASTNFRAPSLVQESFGFTVSDRGEGGQLRQVRTLPPTSPIAQALGVPALAPERSRNVGAGLTAAAGAWSASIDAFQVDIDDRITLSERFAGAALRSFIADRFGSTGIEEINFLANAADVRVRGVDFVGQWTGRAAGGQLRVAAAATMARTSLRRVRPVPEPLSRLTEGAGLVGLEERNTLTDAAPRHRALLSAAWSAERWSLGARVARHGSVVRVFDFGGGFAPRQSYGPATQLDAEIGYRPTPSISIAFGANNLLDRYPDRSSADIAYFGHLPYDYLSPIGFNGALYYVRVRMTWPG